jgi:uncharacterized protein YkwD
MRALISICLAVLAWPVFADPQATAALNAFRTEQEHVPLVYSDALERAARSHAEDMARNDFFSHTGSDGSEVSDRVSAAGYRWCIVAENIAKGQIDLIEVMQAWADSPGHRRNMLSAEVTQFAVARGPDFLWVMVLAAPGC